MDIYGCYNKLVPLAALQVSLKRLNNNVQRVSFLSNEGGEVQNLDWLVAMINEKVRVDFWTVWQLN